MAAVIKYIGIYSTCVATCVAMYSTCVELHMVRVGMKMKFINIHTLYYGF